MVKNIVAVIAGLAVGMVWNMAIVQLNSSVLYPMPEGVDMENVEEFKKYVATLPMSAFLVVLAAHVGQALFGGWVGARLSSSRPAVIAMIIGVLTAAGSVMAQKMFGGPAWMWIDPPLCLVAAWFVGSLETKRRAA